MPELRLDGSSIVLIGSFNPRIFQPFWFSSQGLIRPEEAEKAEIGVVHPEITAVTMGGVSIQVASDRFVATTTQEPIVMRDLVLGTFQVLEHSPVTAMGMNRDLHFVLDAEADWHRLGDTLAPKSVWNEVLSNSTRRTGLISLTIEGLRSDSRAKFNRIKVEPSNRATPFGVYIQVNEHHEGTGDAEGPKAIGYFLDVLRSDWIAAQQFALDAAQRVISVSRE